MGVCNRNDGFCCADLASFHHTLKELAHFILPTSENVKGGEDEEEERKGGVKAVLPFTHRRRGHHQRSLQSPPCLRHTGDPLSASALSQPTYSTQTSTVSP